MADTHPVIAEDGFTVNPLQDKWESGKITAKGDYVLQGESYYEANFDHKAICFFHRAS